MKFGFILPFGDARAAAELGREAEEAGWDGFFLGEAIWHIDAWVALTAAAMTTRRIRLGSMLTPIPGLNPVKLASETATLDNLSGGRVILSLGMGATWMGWQAFPDLPTGARTRAERLDESIDLLTLLYQGRPFDFDGKHYHVRMTAVDAMHYPPPPVQQPRIPIWVVGAWPRVKSMQRVLKCDGLIPAKINPDGQFGEVTAPDLRAMTDYVRANRSLSTPFDVVIEGKTQGLSREQVQDLLCPQAEAGATWFLESLYGASREVLEARLRQGPPLL